MTASEKKQAFVLLELMNHMLLIAQEAKRRGHHVVVLNQGPLQDKGPFAVPDGLVDELVRVPSWSDAEQVGKIVDTVHATYDVVGTYAAFEATLPFEAEIRHRAGLPTSGFHGVTQVLDKARVRRKLYAEGLSTLRSVSLTEALAWESWEFERSAVLKPANGTGSALCFMVGTMDELREAADQVAAAAVVNPMMKEYILSHGEFVLEERAEGELLSVESLVDRGEVHVVGLTGRYVSAMDPVVEQAACFPYPHPRRAEIESAARDFHAALGIGHGPTHLEVMVPDEGPIELIDFNIRMAGLAMAVCMGNAFGIEYAVPLTDIACGERPDLAFLGNARRASADILLLPPPEATVMCELGFPEGTEYGRHMKEIGTPLSGRADQLDVVGMVIVTADSVEELHDRILTVRRETLFDGRPLGDNPNNQLLFPRYHHSATLA
ncbi:MULTISPECIES: ATP-grasp domain-containing protein [unclassified Streptomyces]|uniref:ATP-grasp domain-containing protein n=1 Tax=unclassified Streptomyces TaxID=2593676 RepID=UPI0022B61EA5|nr:MULTISPECIES: ATP-grasp domain-containing protein [unclassified Streptomyces]MCZ7415214.1 ATP-grasp domain-containing protein [Streptomyces sp. WMMC897]MCZ7432159.1 ATP-grasp domain-containing protein [Streptomyces sp. WMMC1477]